jgi:hypothetical protein
MHRLIEFVSGFAKLKSGVPARSGLFTHSQDRSRKRLCLQEPRLWHLFTTSAKGPKADLERSSRASALKVSGYFSNQIVATISSLRAARARQPSHCQRKKPPARRTCRSANHICNVSRTRHWSAWAAALDVAFVSIGAFLVFERARRGGSDLP